MLEHRIGEDLELVMDLRKLSYEDVARGCGVTARTLKRWHAGSGNPDPASLERFYDFAWGQRIELNRIKSQFHREQIEVAGNITLFHGSKTALDGELSLARCSPSNDFGKAFYCGESLEQSALFVADYPKSSLYIAGFDPDGLRCERYVVDQDWMLTIAAFRGRLGEYADHPRVRALVNRVLDADYVVTPIADNRMYEIISMFIDGLATDVVCEHCLSATQLGNQYAFRTDTALGRVRLLERCYLSQGERQSYRARRRSDLGMAEDKVKAARRMFRGQGNYIDELLS